MNTTTIPTKRKIINLNDDTFKTLSIMAIQHGTNLKNFIETTLDKIAENYDDEKLYAYLIKIFPDGKEPLNETPKKILKTGWAYECRLLQTFREGRKKRQCYYNLYIKSRLFYIFTL